MRRWSSIKQALHVLLIKLPGLIEGEVCTYCRPSELPYIIYPWEKYAIKKTRSTDAPPENS